MITEKPTVSFLDVIGDKKFAAFAIWCFFWINSLGSGFDFQLNLDFLYLSFVFFGLVILAYWNAPFRKFVGGVLLFGIGYTFYIKLLVWGRSVLFPYPTLALDISWFGVGFLLFVWVFSRPEVCKIYR